MLFDAIISYAWSKTKEEESKWNRITAGGISCDCASIARLGIYYALGVEKDEVEGVNWFRKEAVQGNAHAQGGLGRSYANCSGEVIKNEIETYK